MEKVDFRKKYRDLYMPGRAPVLIDVPAMTFIMMDGAGDPNGEEYQAAIGKLYALTFAIKMSKMGGRQPQGYYEYVVPPLEGLWWTPGGAFDFDRRDNWRWTSMIRQPEFVTDEVFAWAMAECGRKKPELDLSGCRLETFREGLCVQAMHIGPYADEPATLEQMRRFMDEHDLIDEAGIARKHHEIYLSDPRKTKPESLKTVLRHPVAKKMGG